MASVIVVVAAMLVTSPAWAGLLKAADWQMDDTDGQMLDSSGNNNHGTPTDVVQTRPEVGTYLFNGSTSHVFVPDTNDSLDPLEKDITLRARVMIPDEPMDDDSYDVVRKGLSSKTAGDYKMEIKRASDPTVGKLHCLFKGTNGRVNKVARRPDIVDGEWHTLECIKTGNTVEAVVDGSSYKATGSTGSISNAKEVLVGGKTMTDPFDDMFEGEMDWVSIDISPPSPQ